LYVVLELHACVLSRALLDTADEQGHLRDMLVLKKGLHTFVYRQADARNTTHEHGLLFIQIGGWLLEVSDTYLVFVQQHTSKFFILYPPIKSVITA